MREFANSLCDLCDVGTSGIFEFVSRWRGKNFGRLVMAMAMEGRAGTEERKRLKKKVEEERFRNRICRGGWGWKRSGRWKSARD